jgi:hypothetical protein
VREDKGLEYVAPADGETVELAGTIPPGDTPSVLSKVACTELYGEDKTVEVTV